MVILKTTMICLPNICEEIVYQPQGQ
ncbi:MAG: hypothetical protein ACJAVF_004891, partial [Paraglaciecola sp.]